MQLLKINLKKKRMKLLAKVDISTYREFGVYIIIMNKFELKSTNETQAKLIISLRQLIFVKLVIS